MRVAFDEVFHPVDHSSSIPLYLQIVFQTDNALRTGKLSRDALLPSENELCGGFGVARSTLRRAMGKLEERGIIARERGRGKGTRIVRAAPITRTPGSFATVFNQIAASARKPLTRVLVFEELIVDESLAELTELPFGASVVHIRRQRSANDEPVAVLENWILAEYIGFDASRLEGESLDALLRENGVSVHHAEFEFQAVLLDGDTAEFFQLPEGTPIVQEVRRVFNGEHQYEYSSHHNHPLNERLRGIASP
ncbi:MAG: GntR family transcriptional regulator [Leucobacter sp.]